MMETEITIDQLVEQAMLANAMLQRSMKDMGISRAERRRMMRFVSTIPNNVLKQAEGG
jgi:hypothetical protein